MANDAVVTSPECLPERVEIYRRTMPAKDYAAFEAWLTTFYPFQLEWLLEPSDLAVCNKSRQIGMSHTTSALGVIWAAIHGELLTIISIGEREAREVLDKAKRHAHVLEALGCSFARTKADNQNEIVFVTGGRILSLPSTGGRGFSGNVFLDEYAYIPNASELWDAASAVTMLGYRMRVSSTPNGMGNEFADLCHGKIKGWSKHEITIDDAIAQGYPADIEKCWALAKGDPRIFDQLFRCKFLDTEHQYLPTEAVVACSVNEIARFAPHQGTGFYAGLDIGRTADRTVLVVVFMARGAVRWVQHIRTAKRTDHRGLEAIVAEAFRTFPIVRLCVDASGMGSFECERLQARYGQQRVEAVNFTLQVKEDLATHLYSAFTNQTVRIPSRDEAIPGLPVGAAKELRDDLCSLRRIVTASGNVRYDAPHTDQGHADSAWALALALHACTAPIVPRDLASLPDMS